VNTEDAIRRDVIEKVTIKLELDGQTALAVHGFLALALRHPQASQRPSSEWAAAFARDLLDLLLRADVFTPEGIAAMREALASDDPRTLPARLQQ
jgi:hypothetical protein